MLENRFPKSRESFYMSHSEDHCKFLRFTGSRKTSRICAGDQDFQKELNLSKNRLIVKMIEIVLINNVSFIMSSYPSLIA